MLVIRLARHGRKKVPFYHIVAAEKSRPVKKRFVENLGYYDPLADGGKGKLVFDEKKVEKYVDNGAQMSQTSARLLAKAGFKKAGKFIKNRATKPKKEEPAPEPTETQEAPQDEEAVTETPVEASETPESETVETEDKN